MGMREKLIELIRKADKQDYESKTQDEHYAFMADRLIESGVTIPKIGHWVIKNIKNSEYKYCFCSECLSVGSPRWNVCPLCETKMVGERKDND